MSGDRRSRGVLTAHVDHPELMRDRKRSLNVTFKDLGRSTGASGEYIRKIAAGRCPQIGLSLAHALEAALSFRRGEIFTPDPAAGVGCRDVA